jgi:hypothetical protein
MGGGEGVGLVVTHPAPPEPCLYRHHRRVRPLARVYVGWWRIRWLSIPLVARWVRHLTGQQRSTTPTRPQRHVWAVGLRPCLGSWMVVGPQWLGSCSVCLLLGWSASRWGQTLTAQVWVTTRKDPTVVMLLRCPGIGCHGRCCRFRGRPFHHATCLGVRSREHR